MSDDEEQEVEEDPRITKLYSFADKRSDEDGKYGKKGDTSDIDGEAFATLLDEVGTDNAIVLGGMWMGEASLARAYFTVAALIDADEVTIDKCVELNRIALKAVVKGLSKFTCWQLELCYERAEDKAACLKRGRSASVLLGIRNCRRGGHSCMERGRAGSGEAAGQPRMRRSCARRAWLFWRVEQGE